MLGQNNWRITQLSQNWPLNIEEIGGLPVREITELGQGCVELWPYPQAPTFAPSWKRSVSPAEACPGCRTVGKLVLLILYGFPTWIFVLAQLTVPVGSSSQFLPSPRQAALRDAKEAFCKRKGGQGSSDFWLPSACTQTSLAQSILLFQAKMRGPSNSSTSPFQVNFKPYIIRFSNAKLKPWSLLEQQRIWKTQQLNVILGLGRDGVQEQMLQVTQESKGQGKTVSQILC